MWRKIFFYIVKFRREVGTKPGQSCWPERRRRQPAAEHDKLPARMTLWHAPAGLSSSPIPILRPQPQLCTASALVATCRQTHQQLEFVHSFIHSSQCTVLAACFSHQLQQPSSLLSIIANRSAPATESDKPCMMTPDCNMHAGKRLTGNKACVLSNQPCKAQSCHAHRPAVSCIHAHVYEYKSCTLEYLWKFLLHLAS
jgi:hypothetical protein